MSREILIEPHFEGERFRNQTLPFALLRDLEALQGIILEIAKSAYKENHPHRQRIPRGFSDQLELHLSTRGGSCVAEVALIKDDFLLEGCDPRLQRARAACDRFLEALAHVQEQRPGPPPCLPDSAWPYVEKFGRGLHPDESIRMAAPGSGQVRLTREIRRQLLLSRPGSKPLTEEVEVVAKVVDVRPRDQLMPIELRDGRVIPCNINDQQVAELGPMRVDDFGVRWVLIRGIGLLDGSQQLVRVEEADSTELLDPLDPIVQLEQLRQLAAGWLDGQGVPPSAQLLDQIGAWLETHLRGEQPIPRLYPTPEGGVEAEWLLGRLDLSIEFDPPSNTVRWHAMDLDRNTVEEDTLPLHDAEKLQALGKKLEAVLAEADFIAMESQEAGAP
jgi:hypothetical protein